MHSLFSKSKDEFHGGASQATLIEHTDQKKQRGMSGVKETGEEILPDHHEEDHEKYKYEEALWGLHKGDKGTQWEASEFRLGNNEIELPRNRKP